MSPETVGARAGLRALTGPAVTAEMQAISQQQMFRQPDWLGLAVDQTAEEAAVPLALTGVSEVRRPLGPRREEAVVEEVEQERRRAARVVEVVTVELTVLAGAVVVRHATAAQAAQVATARRGS